VLISKLLLIVLLILFFGIINIKLLLYFFLIYFFSIINSINLKNIIIFGVINNIIFIIINNINTKNIMICIINIIIFSKIYKSIFCCN
jgi:hypothetical protein